MKSSRPNSEYPKYTYSKNKHIFKKKKKKPINNPGSAKFMQNILLEEEM